VEVLKSVEKTWSDGVVKENSSLWRFSNSQMIEGKPLSNGKKQKKFTYIFSNNRYLNKKTIKLMIV
jgi:hypothetical protein